MILFDLKREIFILSKSDKDDNDVLKIPAHVIIKGKAMPGKDVAILKVDSLQELPTLAINNDPTTRIGGAGIGIWIPGTCFFQYILAKETSIDPTLTAGVVSAIKKSIGGWPVIQMDAVISHGSSGSPVCDNNGRVIGLATFGTIQNTGGLANAYNFAIPMSVVKEYLDSAKVVPQVSRATVIYNEGLDLFYKQYYYKALRKFEAVEKLNPGYPGLAYYKDESKKKKYHGPG